MSKRVMEVVLQARNNLGPGLNSARAELSRFRGVTDKNLVFDPNDAREYLNEVKRRHAERLREAQRADQEEFANWRRMEQRKAQQPSGLEFLSKTVLRLEMVKAGFRGASAAIELMSGNLKEADEQLRRMGALGELYSAGSDFLNLYANKVHGIKDFFPNFFRGAAQDVKGALGFSTASDPYRAKWDQEQQQKWYQSRIANMRAANATQREMLDHEREANRLARERGVGQQREAAHAEYMAKIREAERFQENDGDRGVAAERMKEARKALDATLGNINREQGRSRQDLALKMETDRLRERGKMWEAARKEMTTYYDRLREDETDIAEGQLIEERKAYALKQLAQREREYNAAAQEERRNDAIRTARGIVDRLPAPGPYHPTVEGVLAGQQFSGIGAIANSDAVIQNAREAGLAKVQREKMIGILSATLEMNRAIANALRQVGINIAPIN